MADTHGNTELHSALASEHLPFFITAPNQTDWMFVGVAGFVIILILLVGNAYLHLHTLPDRLAHRANSTQLQVVGILTLLALFTHNNLYWVAALLLVTTHIPDFLTPITSIARSLESMSDRDSEKGTTPDA